MRLSSLYLLCLVLLFSIFPTFAQDNEQWSIYLHNISSNSLVHVNSNGEIQNFALDHHFPSFININDDGSLFAGCYDSASGSKNLVVRDIQQENDLFEIELGTNYCYVMAFASDIIALSLTDFGDGSQELHLVDSLTGTTLAALDIESLSAAYPVIEETFGRAFRFSWTIDLNRERIIFNVSSSVEAGSSAKLTFEWHYGEGTITELPEAFGYNNADYLPETGEVVYAGFDESLPSANPYFSRAQPANVVKIFDSSGERTIYQNSELWICNTSFVDSGQSVLVQLCPTFDSQNSQAAYIIHFALVNRDGSIIELPEEFSPTVSVGSLPQGAIFASRPEVLGTSTEILLLEEDNSLSPYMSYPDEGDVPIYIVWTSASEVAANLQPFAGL